MRSPQVWRPWLATLLRLVLAGYIGIAGLVKVADPAESVRAVRAYEILPESVVPLVGHGLPMLEIAVALLLVAGFATRLAAGVSALLMVAFIIGIASAWARGLTIDCGCFGGGGQVDAADTKYAQEIARDTGLLLAAAFLLVWPTSRLSLDPAPADPDDLDDLDDLDEDQRTPQHPEQNTQQHTDRPDAGPQKEIQS